jgi:hypothetical protein
MQTRTDKPELATGGSNEENSEMAQAARLAQAQAERKKASVISVAVFFLFIIAASISTLPSSGVRKKSELIFTIALIAVVGLGVAISVKVSLNKKVKKWLDEGSKTQESKSRASLK